MKTKIYYFFLISTLFVIVFSTVLIFASLLIRNRFIFLGLFFGFYILNIILSTILLNSNKRFESTLSWLIVIYALPFLGIILYIIYGRGFPKVKTNKEFASKLKANYDFKNLEDISKNKLISKQNKLMMSELEKLLDCKFVSNKSLEILDNGTVAYEEIFKKLLSAKKYIFISYFIITDGIVLDALMEILFKKIKENLKVYFIYDPVGSIATISSSKIKKMKNGGINVIDFTIKHKRMPGLFINYRYHRKLIIIDGIYSMYGGINLGNEYVNLSPKYGYWNDNFVIANGNITKYLEKIFIEDWYLCTNKIISLKKMPMLNPSNSEYTLMVASGPNYYKSLAASSIEYMLYQAKKSIKIMTPYLVIPVNILTLIIDSKKRGVDVEIIVPSLPDKKIVYEITMNTCNKLFSHGIKIYKYQNVFMHSKMIIIDDYWSILGSINLDNRSMFQNFEISTINYSEHLNKKCNDFFLNAKNSSVLIKIFVEYSRLKILKLAIYNIMSPLF